MSTLLWTLYFISIGLYVTYRRYNLPVATIIVFVGLSFFSLVSQTPGIFQFLIWTVFSISAALLNLPATRQQWITAPLFQMAKALMPKLSNTEKEALDAGDTSWEAELFSGKPKWQKLFHLPAPTLTPEEHAFLDGPVKTVVCMANDWDITHQSLDLPQEIWQYLKEQGFFGLIIPKEYGGKGFSAYAHSEVITRATAGGITLVSTISVPNSLGPAELLLHYGTPEQKSYYLPRLARGEEIPCFALTSPEAGSDAGSIPDTGIVCKGMFDGEEITGIKLNWDKRYITLAPVATVLGLAFKLYDPEGLLSKQKARGITCALIPVSTPGITIGRRHFPMNTAFQNGPTQGKDVFIPMHWIIGGETMIGRGWQMLVECLSAGRAISLPSTASGGAKVATLGTATYARIRKQFNCSIGAFEGIQEVLARMAGYTYITEAARKMTTAIIDQGVKPSVASAIVKYHTTELGQQVAKDGVDIQGGKAICMGPNNFIARGYQAAPIGITVEGANILTRNMIIYGQGAIRCHPYILSELHAAEMSDNQDALYTFDKAFFGHIGFVLSNFSRTLLLGITNGKLSRVKAPTSVKTYYQSLERYSATLALLSDLAMAIYGGELKRREKVSARLGDLLSYLYLASAVLKRYNDEGQPQEDLPLIHWTLDTLLYRLEETLDNLLNNLPQLFMRIFLRAVVFPFGRTRKKPSDRLDKQIARLLMAPTGTRERLTDNVYTQLNPQHPLYWLEKALQAQIAAEALQQKISQAEKTGFLNKAPMSQQISQAIELKLITEAEADLLLEAEELRKIVIAVDDFSAEELRNQAATPSKQPLWTRYQRAKAVSS